MGTQVVGPKRMRQLIRMFGWPEFSRMVVGPAAAPAEGILLVDGGHEHWWLDRQTGECGKIAPGDGAELWSCSRLPEEHQTWL